MEDYVNTRKRFFQRSRITHVTSDDLDFAGKIVRDAGRMNLRCQVVQHADTMTGAKQAVG
jgi:hypothetical protein